MCPQPLHTHAINISSAGRSSDGEQYGIEMGEGRRSVKLPSDSDVEITVAEDEPEKGAVEVDIATITAKQEFGLHKYFDKWTGGIDKSLPFPSVQDVTVSWLGAFIG